MENAWYRGIYSGKNNALDDFRIVMAIRTGQCTCFDNISFIKCFTYNSVVVQNTIEKNSKLVQRRYRAFFLPEGFTYLFNYCWLEDSTFFTGSMTVKNHTEANMLVVTMSITLIQLSCYEMRFKCISQK